MPISNGTGEAPIDTSRLCTVQLSLSRAAACSVQEGVEYSSCGAAVSTQVGNHDGYTEPCKAAGSAAPPGFPGLGSPGGHPQGPVPLCPTSAALPAETHLRSGGMQPPVQVPLVTTLAQEGEKTQVMGLQSIAAPLRCQGSPVLHECVTDESVVSAGARNPVLAQLCHQPLSEASPSLDLDGPLQVPASQEAVPSIEATGFSGPSNGQVRESHASRPSSGPPGSSDPARAAASDVSPYPLRQPAKVVDGSPGIGAPAGGTSRRPF